MRELALLLGALALVERLAGPLAVEHLAEEALLAEALQVELAEFGAALRVGRIVRISA